MFNKILIANRGEIALRIIRTCKVMDIETVAVYSEADEESVHVKFVTEAYCIGPPPSKDSYLDIDKIIKVAKGNECRCYSSWLWILIRECGFSQACKDNGIKFIGATPTD